MKYSLIILFLFTSLSDYAQPRRERLKESGFDPNSFPEFKTGFSKKKKDYPWVVDFNAVQFLDMRSDTSKVGFILAPVNSFTDEYHRVVFPKPAAEYLTKTMKDFYTGDPDAGASLTIVLRQLWVSERMVTPNTVGRQILVGSIDQLSYCYLGADCYASSGGQHQYLGNIDTVVSVRRLLTNAADDLFRKTMFEALNKANILFKKSDKASTAINTDALHQQYYKSISHPVLQVEEPARGVYLTYPEFLQNKPSFINFTVERTKKKEIMHCPGIEDSLLAKAWGYYDSTGLNIHMNDNYYRAVRTQNTFEVAGPRTILSLYSTEEKIFTAVVESFFSGLASGGLSLALMGGHNKTMKELVPYQLNVFDGTVY